MNRKLTLVGLLVGTYTYFFVTAYLMLFHGTVTNSTVDESIYDIKFLEYISYGIVLVVPTHFFIIYNTYKSGLVDMAFAIPYFIMPYMLGITAQAISL